MALTDDWPPIRPERFPRRRVVLELSESVVDWLRDRARDDKERDATRGKPSVSAVVERVLRRATK